MHATRKTDIIGHVPTETARVLPSEWEILRDLRLSALHDSPSAFGSAYADEVGRSDEEWIRRASMASAGDGLATFIARIEGVAIGIAGGHRPDETTQEVELVSMWTSPDARRSGAGRALVREIVDWATGADAHSVGLWVMQGNAAAERLYESMGFRAAIEYEPRPSDPCADELRMSLPLR